LAKSLIDAADKMAEQKAKEQYEGQFRQLETLQLALLQYLQNAVHTKLNAKKKNGVLRFVFEIQIDKKAYATKTASFLAFEQVKNIIKSRVSSLKLPTIKPTKNENYTN
jgi:hypothetical protein